MSKYNAMKSFGFLDMNDVLSVIVRAEKELEGKGLVEKKFVISRCAGGWRFRNELNQYRSDSISSDEIAAECLNVFLEDVIFLKNTGVVKSVRIEIINTLTNSFEFKFL